MNIRPIVCRPGQAQNLIAGDSVVVLRRARLGPARRRSTEGQRRSTAKSLVNDAVALGEFEQLLPLFRIGIGVDCNRQPDRLESDGRISGDPERAPKFEVPHGSHATAAQLNTQ